MDCAWTYAFNQERYGPLLEAVRAATETGIREVRREKKREEKERKRRFVLTSF